MLLRILPLVMMVATAASAGTSQVSVTGEYTSNWGDVRLVQEGSYVRGTYVCCGGGTIEGRVSQRVLRYHWRQPGGEGRGVWEIEGGRLLGTWGVGDSESDGGRWDLERKAAIASSAH